MEPVVEQPELVAEVSSRLEEVTPTPSAVSSEMIEKDEAVKVAPTLVAPVSEELKVSVVEETDMSAQVAEVEHGGETERVLKLPVEESDSDGSGSEGTAVAGKEQISAVEEIGEGETGVGTYQADEYQDEEDRSYSEEECSDGMSSAGQPLENSDRDKAAIEAKTYSILMMMMIREKGLNDKANSLVRGLTGLTEKGTGATGGQEQWRGHQPPPSQRREGNDWNYRDSGTQGGSRQSHRSHAGGGSPCNFGSFFNQPPQQLSSGAGWRPQDNPRGSRNAMMGRRQDDMGRRPDFVRREGVIPTFLTAQVTDDVASAHLKKIKPLLNKFSPDNFDKLYPKMNDLIVDYQSLDLLVKLIWDVSVTQHNNLPMYVAMCARLNVDVNDERFEKLKSTATLPEGMEPQKHIRGMLISRCQQRFESMMGKNDFEMPEGLSEDDKFVYLIRHKMKCNGNMKFIGQLFRKHLLSSSVIHNCINDLIQVDDDILTEALVEFLKIVGPLMDLHPKYRGNKREPYNESMKRLDEKVERMGRKGTSEGTRLMLLLETLVARRNEGWLKVLEEDEELRQIVQSAPPPRQSNDARQLGRTDSAPSHTRDNRGVNEGGWQSGSARKNQPNVQPGRQQSYNTAQNREPHYSANGAAPSMPNRYGVLQRQQRTGEPRPRRPIGKDKWADPSLDNIQSSMALGGGSLGLIAPKESDPASPAFENDQRNGLEDATKDVTEEVELVSAETSMPASLNEQMESIAHGLLRGEDDVEDAVEATKEFPKEFSAHFIEACIFKHVIEEMRGGNRRTAIRWIMTVVKDGVFPRSAFQQGLDRFLANSAEYVLDAPLLPGIVKDTLVPCLKENDPDRVIFTAAMEEALLSAGGV
eukprot:GHVN01077202.1.p1 GENE.GHVN01077202.1~~GHVN01077202.1.p1  ORF type:complete len:924 (+),score=178.16 GHVN01077202.1:169-2772(+)